MQNQIKVRQRRNRVFKSLHKPLTYLGVERSLFLRLCTGSGDASTSSIHCWPALQCFWVAMPSAHG